MQYESREKFKFLSFKSSKSVKLFVSILSFALAAVFCLCLDYIKNLSSEYNVKQFFPKKHVLLEQEKKTIEYFKIQEKSAFIVLLKAPRESKWVETANLKKLQDFTFDISQNKLVTHAFSLGNIQGSFEVNSDLYVGDLFSQVPASHWKTMIKQHPFIKPNLLSENEKEALVVIELKENTPLSIEKFQTFATKLQQKKYSEVDIKFAGIPLLQKDVSQLLKTELIRSIFYGLIIFVFALICIFSNWSGIVISVTNLIFINIVTLGLLSLLKIKLDVLLSTLPVLISLSSITMTVQILMRVAEFEDYFSTNKILKFRAIIKNLKHLFVENFLASMSISIGFLMLASSDIMIISKYGKAVAFSILLCWLITQLFLIPTMYYFPAIKLRKWSSQKAYWSLKILNFKKPILIFGLAIFVFGMISFNFLNWNTRLFDDLPKFSSSRINTERLDAKFGGTIPLSLVIYGKNKTWTQPKNFNNLDRLATEIKNLASVGTVISSADFLKKSSLNGSRLPASSAEANEALFVFSMAENDPTTTFLNQINFMTRLEIRLKDFPANVQNNDLIKIRSLVKKYFPDLKFSLTGMGVSAHKLNKEMSEALIFRFWHSLLFIGFILIFVFRSIRWAVLACIPNFIPPLALILVLGINSTPIKPGIAIIFSIAVGLAFSNTVYLLGKLKKTMSEKNLKNYLPIKQMLLTEMIPCLLATVLVLSAFIIFSFSYFEMNKSFGVYMILSLVAGAFGDLVLLPSILKTFPNLLLNKPKQNRLQKTELMYVSLFGLMFFSFLISSKSLAATVDVAALMKKSQALMSSKDDSADILMKILEKDGSVKERQLHIKRKQSSGKHMTLVKLKKPNDLKGTALLSILENGHEDQWIYLPSTKQTRRVMGHSKKGGVLGSELSAEDLDVSTVKGSKAQFVKQIKCGQDSCAVIEVKSETNNTKYSKALLLISLKTSLPQRLEYYNKKNVAIKRVDFENYIQTGHVFRAQSIRVKNLVNKRGTDLIFSNVKSNSGLSEDEFSQRALSRE